MFDAKKLLESLVTGFGAKQDMPGGNATSWVMPNIGAITALYDAYCNCLKSGPAGGPGDFPRLVETIVER